MKYLTIKYLPSFYYFSCREFALPLILLGLLLLGKTAYAQVTSLDSIHALLEASKNENRQQELLLLAADLALKEDSTVKRVPGYVSQLRALQHFDKDSTTIMETLRMEAHANRIMGNYSRSIRDFLTCHSYYGRVGDTVNLVFTSNQLGAMFSFRGQHQKAQDYLLQVYRIHKKQGDKRALAGANNGLAIFYNNTEQVDRAIERYNEALQMYEEVKDTLGQANVHANLGLSYIEQGEYGLAEFHIAMQGKLDSLLNSQWGLGFYFDFLGYLREKQGRNSEALHNYLQSLSIRKDLASKYNLTESRVSIANMQLKLKNYDEAIKEARKVLVDLEERNSLYQQQSAYRILSEAFEGKQNLRSALDYHKLFSDMSDSIYNSEMLETISEKDALFENAQKESEITLLNLDKQSSQKVIEQKNRTIVFGSMGFVLVSMLCLGLYFITRKYLRQKQKLALTLGEKDILLREIHHRVKNNLQLVSSLLTLQGRSITDSTAQMAIEEGKSRIRSMAIIHQDLYQKENITSVNAQEYMQKLCNELLETYRLGNGQIRLYLEVEQLHIDVDTLVPLGLITNELMTNSLKYAFPGQREGTVGVFLKHGKDVLMLTIMDDGIGYDPEKISHSSFGHRLIKSLAEQLEAQVDIIVHQGTKTTLTIPYLKN